VTIGVIVSTTVESKPKNLLIRLLGVQTGLVGRMSRLRVRTATSVYQWFNNHLNVRVSSPIVETSAAVPLISMRPFAAAKWSAWPDWC